MSMNDLFYTDQFQVTEKTISAVISLNDGHKIFSGHFPGQPILPGVCMIHIVKELLVKALQTDLRLIKTDQIKFLTVIDPRHTPSFHVKIDFDWMDTETIKASGSFFNGTTVYFKVQGSLFGGVSHKMPVSD